MAEILVTTGSVANCEMAMTLLRQAGHNVVVQIGRGDMAEDIMADLVRGKDALIVGVDRVTAKVVASGAPTLKVIARNGVGYNNVDIIAAKQHGVEVTIAPGASTVSVAELALGLMLALARNIVCQNSHIQAGSWERPMGQELFGKTLGVLGVGAIGREVVKRAIAFGMNVLACDPVRDFRFAEEQGFSYVTQEEMLSGADVLTLHAPSLPATNRIINESTLRHLKPGTLLVNTARGELVDAAAVREAILSGRLGGYATDTLEREPPPPGDPLLGLSNVILTPHCGAYTAQAVERCGIIVVREVLAVLAGKTPLYPVPKTER